MKNGPKPFLNGQGKVRGYKSQKARYNRLCGPVKISYKKPEK